MESPQSYIVNDRLSVLGYVNSGTYGSVHKACYTHTGETVALKVVHVTPDTRKSAERELAISLRMDHPSVVRTYEAFEIDGNLALVQEYADGGDLFDFINDFGFGHDEATIKGVFAQMASGIAYLHSQGVSHRDLKPENILLAGRDRAAVKITDFGLSEESRYVRGRVGTDPYCAPEVVRLPGVHTLSRNGRRSKSRGKRIDGYAADVFSLGVTLVAMITGRLPWGVADEATDPDYAEFVARLLTYGVEGAVFVQDPTDLGVSPNLCRLLDAMLHPDPRRRAKVRDVYEYLNLRWFTRVDTYPTSSTASTPAAATTTEVTINARGALVSTITKGKCGVVTSTGGDLDSGISSGATGGESDRDTASLSASMLDLCIESCGYDDDEALGDELPPLPSFLVKSA